MEDQGAPRDATVLGSVRTREPIAENALVIPVIVIFLTNHYPYIVSSDNGTQLAQQMISCPNVDGSTARWIRIELQAASIKARMPLQ